MSHTYLRCVQYLALPAILQLFPDVVALENGLALAPPLGWRSWNQIGLFDTNHTAMEDIFRLMAGKSFGGPKSLVQLGYDRAGVDDGWQQCAANSNGFVPPYGYGYHDNSTGMPIVNLAKFPDMKAMTKYAKTLGIKPGWYGNNCYCRDMYCDGAERCFEGDVRATLEWGFEGVKYDSCGSLRNMTKWAALYNASGKQIMLEDCGNGFVTPSDPSRGMPQPGTCTRFGSHHAHAHLHRACVAVSYDCSAFCCLGWQFNPATAYRDNTTGELVCPMNM
eukprot:SAG11_NODE_217_length_12229_cov_9.152185_19_plen_277_part_00